MEEQEANILTEVIEASPHTLNVRVERMSPWRWSILFETPYNRYTVTCPDAEWWKVWCHAADNGWITGQTEIKP